jgi:hypothetical protein
MIEDMQVRNLALNTQRVYVGQVSLFARHFNKSPELLGPKDIRAYQLYLTNERKLSPSSVVTAVAALHFVYKITLKKTWNLEEVIPAPKLPQKLPCRSRQGPKRSLCNAVAGAAGDPAHLVASGKTEPLALSRRHSRTAHHRRLGSGGLPERPQEFWHTEAYRSSFTAAWIFGPLAGIRY